MTTTNKPPCKIDLDKLEALARAATPGPWLHRVDTGNKGMQHCLKLPGELGAWVADCLDNADRRTDGGIAGERNAQFIAAANPATILKLIAQARASQPAASDAQPGADERALTMKQAFDAVGGWMNGGELGYPSFGSMNALWAYTVKMVRSYAANEQARAALATPAVQERCTSCDGTGDMHTPDGQWLGECTVCNTGTVQADADGSLTNEGTIGQAGATVADTRIPDAYDMRHGIGLSSLAAPASPATGTASIGDDKQFQALLDDFAYKASERRAMGGDFGSAEGDEVAEAALIAHIDAHVRAQVQEAREYQRKVDEKIIERRDAEIADLRAQLASERQAKEYEQRHAVESEKALAQAQAQISALKGLRQPVAYRLGNEYRTQAGDWVRFVKVHNGGRDHETMEDQHGVNRYTRRDFGRVTGTAHDYSYPGNTPPLYATPVSAPGAQQGDERAAVLGEALKACAQLEVDCGPVKRDEFAIHFRRKGIQQCIAAIRALAAAPAQAQDGGQSQADAIESVVGAARRVYRKFGADSDWSEWRDLGNALSEYDSAAHQASAQEGRQSAAHCPACDGFGHELTVYDGKRPCSLCAQDEGAQNVDADQVDSEGGHHD